MSDSTPVIRVISNGKHNSQVVILRKDGSGKMKSTTRHLWVNSAVNGMTDVDGNIYRENDRGLRLVGNVRKAA